MLFRFESSIYMYDASVWGLDMYRSDGVVVKSFDDLIIIRRGSGVPKEAVSGRADVVVGLDEHGRVVNVEIDFVDYYYTDREKAREVLRRARW